MMNSIAFNVGFKRNDILKYVFNIAIPHFEYNNE